jgi:hypothetical protein
MALTPSTELLDRMLRAIASTPSYTGGDQGFLNAFLAGAPAAVTQLRAGARAPLPFPQSAASARAAGPAGLGSSFAAAPFAVHPSPSY